MKQTDRKAAENQSRDLFSKNLCADPKEYCGCLEDCESGAASRTKNAYNLCRNLSKRCSAAINPPTGKTYGCSTSVAPPANGEEGGTGAAAQPEGV